MTTTPETWPDLNTYSTVLLLAHLNDLRQQRTYKEAANLIIEVRTYALRISAAERMLAIHNRRATEEEDRRSPAGIPQMDVDALLATLSLLNKPEARAVVADMWAALQAQQTQREADLREAVLHGVHFAQDSAKVTDGGCGPTIDWVDDGRAEEEGARYARSKAGG